jgi:hypothetical protein
MIDRDWSPAPAVLCIALFGVAWAVVRVARCICVLENLVEIVAANARL